MQKAQTFASLGVQHLVITSNTGHMAEILAAMDILTQHVLVAFQSH